MGMATVNTEKALTVTEVAARFGRDSSRIRQICIEHDIGVLIAGRLRVLTEKDAEKIGRLLEGFGRKPVG
jgi:hypothetical protein